MDNGLWPICSMLGWGVSTTENDRDGEYVSVCAGVCAHVRGRAVRKGPCEDIRRVKFEDTWGHSILSREKNRCTNVSDTWKRKTIKGEW